MQLVDGTQAPRTLIDIQGAGHYDFVMIGLLSPLAPYLGIKGPIPAERAMPLINEVMLAFFDTHLKGQSDRMAQVLQRYPEASLR
jgi:hypothetical protein